MAAMTKRLRERLERDFPEPGSATEAVRIVDESSDLERVQAAIVLWAKGDLGKLRDASRLAHEDWRDALVRGELADDDWQERLDAELGLSDATDVEIGGQPRDVVTLWRPTGPEELALVEASGWRRWPPRLPDQPIFYPVLNEDYAIRIARDWNVKASGVGHVTRFDVRREHLEQYEVQQVGGETILEYWIPAERLDELNDNIVGTIEVVRTFR
ncbi:hypothetical protein [Cellulomonas composti]|uniref:hypothetical protein n=1 Tax=Cellulomonas composti TaxID=266130 RepID=UPI001FE4D90D|nr:hypothetical protein [Cellulomonas composti]